MGMSGEGQSVYIGVLPQGLGFNPGAGSGIHLPLPKRRWEKEAGSSEGELWKGPEDPPLISVHLR